MLNNRPDLHSVFAIKGLAFQIGRCFTGFGPPFRRGLFADSPSAEVGHGMPSIADKLGFLSAAETAARLKIGPDSLKRLVAQDRIPYVTTPLGRLFVESEITEYAKTFVPPRRGRPPKGTSSRRRSRSVTHAQPGTDRHTMRPEQAGGETR
ncbi:helix-turn-helix domain-containing protein [Saccharopolyspora phatthalungensis]|uniref:Helix-turn-helix domain-containing protein n=1 Tax=Saccharopolyspora phatthalungensis TaxID=664693 RepID=A0A840QDH2_9PSEU|nr:helix-turn-helix domain-containing protein [Saccharopolyspora phatthalungensis]MBB5156609.1 hypothetical protein [Saccharopolyspora phatthalungensis]